MPVKARRSCLQPQKLTAIINELIVDPQSEPAERRAYVKMR